MVACPHALRACACAACLCARACVRACVPAHACDCKPRPPRHHTACHTSRTCARCAAESRATASGHVWCACAPACLHACVRDLDYVDIVVDIARKLAIRIGSCVVLKVRWHTHLLPCACRRADGAELTRATVHALPSMTHRGEPGTGETARRDRALRSTCGGIRLRSRARATKQHVRSRTISVAHLWSKFRPRSGALPVRT